MHQRGALVIGICVFLVFAMAKIAAIWSTLSQLSFVLLLSYCWQDAVFALAFGLAAIPLERRAPRFVATLYWIFALYAALNIFVERAVFTPLTLPMLRAAGGPLSDSMRLYLTPLNIALVIAVLAVAFVLPPFMRKIPSAATFLLLIVIAAGTIAAPRFETHGMERNAVLTLLGDCLPRAQAAATPANWRRSDASPAEDLTTLTSSARGFNIIMISLESTAAQYLSLFGASVNPMPNLSALASNGLVFENAYAVYPESIKGLYSVLCSAYPRIGTQPEAYEHSNCDSIAAVLARNGYRTAMFHSGRFDYLGMNSVIRNRGYQTLADARDIGGAHSSSFGVDEPSTVSRMLAWIDALPSGQRFFLTYLPIAGHHPYATPEAGPFHASNDLEQYRNALYYGDRSLGALIAGLRARGLNRNTLWIIYGDHGEAFNQHTGNYGHTFFLYDENVHVPFVIAAPGLMNGQKRLNKIVSLIDTAPTVLDLVGITAAPTYQGRSMLAASPRNALFFTDYSLDLLGVRDGRWKFIYETGSARTELYDVQRDPRETVNLAVAEPSRVSRYRELVRSWSTMR